MKPVDIRSLTDIRFVSAPALSPDGGHTGYVVESMNYKENRYEACIHLLDNTTGLSRQMTFSGREDGFAWEDAHTLLFQARRSDADKPKKREDKTVFYRLDVRGGEAMRAFEVPLDVKALRPLGGGRYVVSAKADLNAPPKDLDEALLEDWDDYHVLEEIPFWGNGRGFVSRRRTALFLYDAANGDLRKLTEDFFDVSDFDVKGDRLLYAGCAYRDVPSLYGEVKLCDLRTLAVKNLVEPGKYDVGTVLLTEKSAVVQLSTMIPWGRGQLRRWHRCDPDTGALQPTEDIGRYPGCAGALDCGKGGGKEAAAAGESVVFIAQREYRSEICRLRADDTVETLVPFEGNVLWLDADGENLVFVAMAPDSLPELYALKDSAVRKLTSFNGDFLANHAVAHAEYLPFTNAEGIRIDGWVLKPADFDPAKRYPGVLEIHGGPRGAYGTAFFHEMQALCAAGYVVFFCNPRGSEGYGEAFADLRGRYGTIDYADLMAFTDHVLSRVPQIDPARLGACGGSYGGFMCNWIVGHTDRFAAIASQRSISNWVSDFGNSEIGFSFDTNEMRGDPWTAQAALWDRSPLKYADRARTPILFIHSMEDYNCCVEQGAQMFTAMKYFGVPTRMVLFEKESHSLSRSGKPRHRIRRLEEILGWFDRYLKTE